ncbi:hypothetical protein P5G51_007415 [Virgibacillus sp. 179-BFC.A HS]|uniref:Uncharacterized protein n=1 Tax=Tigheibacillus jepli TaxID=3035914 RepID=A0ABU5CG22_9BACI|nr:hypothetical protein [Virgibacillus sp. 179-BFC.A HS]MDY0405255.1 hypothetical protein [Virgibacillus sp. 179-BFC.A HS]
MMEFLYFPDDKSEYLPAVIVLLLFMIGAVIMMYILIKKSKKEEKQFNHAYRPENRLTKNNEQHGHTK